MSANKLQLRDEEYEAVQRYAESIGVKTEDVAYAALNRLMLQLKTDEPAIRQDIIETKDWRPDNLPLWSDTARSVHLYEGKNDAFSVPSRWRE
jgi:hypothetical protein